MRKLMWEASMKRLLFFGLLISSMANAQVDFVPDSPLDTSMGEAAGDTAGTVNQIVPSEYERQQEEEREEELLENRYDVPDDKEEEEFNQNGN